MQTTGVSGEAARAAGRWFYSGVGLMLLFACGHFAGFLQARHAARHDPKMADLTRAMREHQTRLLGFEPSILDFREYFSVNFSVLLVFVAVAEFLALQMAADRPAAIRALSLVNVAAMAALVGTSLVYSVPQGLISCATIAAVFLVAWWRA